MAAPQGGGVVHPLEVDVPAPAPPVGEAQPQGRINGLPVLAGRPLGLVLRSTQLAAAVVALVVLVSAAEFPTVLSLRYHFGATVWQLAWCFFALIGDICAVGVGCSLQNIPALLTLVLGDLLTACLLQAAASMSEGVIFYVYKDLHLCAGHPCTRFQIVLVISFSGYFVLVSTFVLNSWALASRSLAGVLHPVE
ncbi:hypothetical protein EJB05_24965, partial [Eragrostis curvula]